MEHLALSPHVRFELIEQRLALVTLDRPAKRNAVNGEMARAVQAIRRHVEASDDIWAGIFCSAVPGIFCAGADLGEVAAGRVDTITPDDDGFAGFADAERTKPWIAAVDGHAVAGGCELALACDMIVSTPESSFAVAEVKRGMIAGGGGVYRLARLIPRNIANEMLATGNPISGERAHAHGLVNRLTPSGGALAGAIALAREILENAPLSVRASLTLSRAVFDHPERELRAKALATGSALYSTEDFKEGPKAFLEKRRPAWQGR